MRNGVFHLGYAVHLFRIPAALSLLVLFCLLGGMKYYKSATYTIGCVCHLSNKE